MEGGLIVTIQDELFRFFNEGNYAMVQKSDHTNRVSIVLYRGDQHVQTSCGRKGLSFEEKLAVCFERIFG